MSHDVYENPLTKRYASKPMAELWSEQRKHSTWRRLWVALAEAQSRTPAARSFGASEFALNADQFRRVGSIVLVEPVGVDQPRRVVVRRGGNRP